MSERCSICHKPFRSAECPHSFGQVMDHNKRVEEDKHITKLVRKIVQEELKKAGLLS